MAEAKERLEYRKPVVLKLELEADEVMAGGCKTGPGRASGSLSPPCWIVPCTLQGS